MTQRSFNYWELLRHQYGSDIMDCPRATRRSTQATRCTDSTLQRLTSILCCFSMSCRIVGIIFFLNGLLSFAESSRFVWNPREIRRLPPIVLQYFPSCLTTRLQFQECLATSQSDQMCIHNPSLLCVVAGLDLIDGMNVCPRLTRLDGWMSS
jgi:hypothetical protein